MKQTMPTPTLSAEVVTGKKTRRVKHVKRPTIASPGTAKRWFAKDPSTRGLDYAMVCISIPVEELVAMDALAERCQMARSHLIRQAVKHFAVKVSAK